MSIVYGPIALHLGHFPELWDILTFGLSLDFTRMISTICSIPSVQHKGRQLEAIKQDSLQD